MPKDKGSRPLPPLSGIRFIVCPKCGIPTRPINTIDVVTFPDDVQVVEEIVAGEFNTFRHFCGEQISVVTPVVVTWAEKKLTLAVAAEDPTNGAGAERGWRLGHVEDYVGLQQVVIAWLAVDGNVLLTMLRDNSYFDLDRAGQIAAATPLRLLALSLEGRRRRASAQSPAEVKESEWFDGLATVVIAEFLRQLAIESAHNSVLNLIDIIRRAVPRQCLTPAVLDALRGACNDRVFASMPPDRDRLGVSFRAELVNAAAHVVADCDNPREVQWAIMIVSMWELSRRKQFYVDDRYFLDAVTLQSTLTFPTLLHVAGEIGIPEDAEDYQKTLTDFFLRYVDLMARAGYGKQFIEWEQETHARAITVSPQKPQPADLFAIVQEQLGDERWQGLSLGEVAASFTERWTRSFPDQTTQIVRAFNDDISRKGTLNDVCRYVTESTRWLNGRREWQLSGEIVDELLGRLEHSEVDLSAEQRADLWNEIGNTCRYLDAAEQSLTAYTLAKKASVGLPDEDQRLAILAHNRAIVLRDSGRLTEAEAEFKQLEAAQPDDAGVLHSLAVLYDHVGRVEEAVDYLARALAIPTLLPDEAALFLFSRAHAHQQLGADDAALTDLQRAWQILSTNSGDLRLRIATVGVRCRPTDSNLQAFRDELVGFALEHGSASAHVRGSAGAMALLAIAEAALLRGDTRAARSALEIVLPAPRIPNPAHIGEVAVAWAWLLVVEGAPGAWPWLVASLQSHESSMPREGDASFALTWLRRTAKVTDRILELAPRVTSEASDLIWVYETANGRELTAADQLPDRPPNWTELVRDATRAVPSDLVVLLDGIERITAIVFQAASAEPVVQPVDLTSAELDAAVAALAAFDDANPVAPHRIDRKLKAWWRAAATLADAVRPWLTDGAELVILPGRRLASTPLHLAGWPQTPLIFDRPVSVCPNARILTAPQSTGNGSVGIVVVPKVGDTPQFRTSLIRSANEIAQSAVAARVLLERDADAPAVLILAGECDEIVFLCHGLSSAGPSQGPGICVSASGYLPPNPLPVEADNDLSAFALSWSDFLGLPRGPRVIVSMACSTGRTVIGPGGSRIGLEQCFLTRGGTAIISPLWNVDQEPSLAWLGSFYDAHTSGASGDVGIAHRLACLETLQRYSHPFAWGSFLLTRRLPRRPT